MATVTKTFSFTSSIEGWQVPATTNGLTLSWANSGNTPPSALKVVFTNSTGFLNSQAGYFWYDGTWEDLGVPAGVGAVVTQVQVTSLKRYAQSVSAPGGTTIVNGPVDIYAGGAFKATLLSGRSVTAVDGGYNTSGAGTAWSVDSGFQASNSTIQLRINNNISIQGNGTDVCYIDDLNLLITYNIPVPTYTGSAVLAVGHPTLKNAAIFTIPVYTGSGKVSTQHPTLKNIATLTIPVYTGTGILSAQHPTLKNVATFTIPKYTGTGKLSTQHPTLKAQGSRIAPVYTGGSALGLGGASTPVIIDNVDAGFSSTGSWGPSSIAGKYGTNSLVILTVLGSPTAVANWSFTGLNAGKIYDLALSWSVHTNRNPIARWFVYDSDNTTVLASGTVAQNVAANDFVYLGVNWENIASVAPSGSSLKVSIDNVGTDTASNTVADAVYLKAQAPRISLVANGNTAVPVYTGKAPLGIHQLTPRIIDNVDAGFSVTGSWGTTSIHSYGTNAKQGGLTTGPATLTATWLFDNLNSGMPCQIAMTWGIHASACTATRWFIYDSDNTTLLASGTINQTILPSNFTYAGVPWDNLANVTPSGTTLKVFMDNVGVGNFIIADAVYLKPLAPGANLNQTGSFIKPVYSGKALLNHSSNLVATGVSNIPVYTGSVNLQTQKAEIRDVGIYIDIPTSVFYGTANLQTGKVRLNTVPVYRDLYTGSANLTTAPVLVTNNFSGQTITDFPASFQMPGLSFPTVNCPYPGTELKYLNQQMKNLKAVFAMYDGLGSIQDAISGKTYKTYGKLESLASEPVDYALKFNGINTFIKLDDGLFNYANDGAKFDYASGFSVWFKTKTGGAILGQGGGTNNIPGGTSAGNVPVLYIGTDGKIYASYFWHGEVSAPLDFPGKFNDDKWHHIYIGWQNNRQIVVVDGKWRDETSYELIQYNTSYSYTLGVANTADWYAANNSWFYFNGYLAQPRVYDGPVSNSALRQMANEVNRWDIWKADPHNIPYAKPAVRTGNANLNVKHPVVGAKGSITIPSGIYRGRANVGKHPLLSAIGSLPGPKGGNNNLTTLHPLLKAIGSVSVPAVDSTDLTVWGHKRITTNDGAVFDPLSTNIPCKLWLRAESINGFDNQRVSVWKDESGYNNDVQQNYFIRQPTYKQGIFHNKWPAVRFDGFQQYLSTGGLFNLQNASGVTIFAVIKNFCSNPSGSGVYIQSDINKTLPLSIYGDTTSSHRYKSLIPLNVKGGFGDEGFAFNTKTLYIDGSAPSVPDAVGNALLSKKAKLVATGIQGIPTSGAKLSKKVNIFGRGTVSPPPLKFVVPMSLDAPRLDSTPDNPIESSEPQWNINEASLEGLWPLRDKIGGVAQEFSKGLHGQTSNITWLEDTELGGAASFNGDSEILAASPGDPANWCISAWFKTGDPDQVLGFIAYNGSLTTGYGISVNSGNLTLLYGGVGFRTISSVTIEADTLYHVVVQRRADGFLEVWLNGVRYISEPYASTPVAITNGLFGIGHEPGHTDRYFNGVIGEVRFYSKFLSGSKIKQLYSPSTRWDMWKPKTHRSLLLLSQSTGHLAIENDDKAFISVLGIDPMHLPPPTTINPIPPGSSTLPPDETIPPINPLPDPIPDGPLPLPPTIQDPNCPCPLIDWSHNTPFKQNWKLSTNCFKFAEEPFTNQYKVDGPEFSLNAPGCDSHILAVRKAKAKVNVKDNGYGGETLGPYGNVIIDNPAPLYIGADLNTNPQKFLSGDIAEILVYDGNLSDDDFLNVETYLRNKYCGGAGNLNLFVEGYKAPGIRKNLPLYEYGGNYQTDRPYKYTTLFEKANDKVQNNVPLYISTGTLATKPHGLNLTLKALPITPGIPVNSQPQNLKLFTKGSIGANDIGNITLYASGDRPADSIDLYLGGYIPNQTRALNLFLKAKPIGDTSDLARPPKLNLSIFGDSPGAGREFTGYGINFTQTMSPPLTIKGRWGTQNEAITPLSIDGFIPSMDAALNLYLEQHGGSKSIPLYIKALPGGTSGLMGKTDLTVYAHESVNSSVPLTVYMETLAASGLSLYINGPTRVNSNTTLYTKGPIPANHGMNLFLKTFPPNPFNGNVSLITSGGSGIQHSMGLGAIPLFMTESPPLNKNLNLYVGGVKSIVRINTGLNLVLKSGPPQAYLATPLFLMNQQESIIDSLDLYIRGLGKNPGYYFSDDDLNLFINGFGSGPLASPILKNITSPLFIGGEIKLAHAYHNITRLFVKVADGYTINNNTTLYVNSNPAPQANASMPMVIYKTSLIDIISLYIHGF